MPPRIIPILDRLRQDIAAGSVPGDHRGGLPPGRVSLAQAAPRPGDDHLPVPPPGPPRQHRLPARRPLRRLDLYRQRLLPGPQAAPPGRLRPARRADRRRGAAPPPTAPAGSGIGSGSSTAPASRCPTSRELQRHFGQPGNQRKGCGFPVAKWLALFDVATGMLLRSTTAPLRTHDMSQVGPDLRRAGAGRRRAGGPGLLLVCSPGDVARTRPAGRLPRPPAADRRLHAGPPDGQEEGPVPQAAGPAELAVGAGPEASRIRSSYGSNRNPSRSGCRRRQFAALPEEITVRELRYRVETPGYRVCEITLVTTLLDASTYPAAELAELYYKRWQSGTQFSTYQDQHEDGRPALRDGRRGAQGAGDLQPGVQPGAGR